MKILDENSIEKLNFYLFLGKVVAKNRAFGNNIIFLQQFFSGSGDFEPPLRKPLLICTNGTVRPIERMICGYVASGSGEMVSYPKPTGPKSYIFYTFLHVFYTFETEHLKSHDPNLYVAIKFSALISQMMSGTSTQNWCRQLYSY